MHLTFYRADSLKWVRNKKYNQKGLPSIPVPICPGPFFPGLSGHSDLPEAFSMDMYVKVNEPPYCAPFNMLGALLCFPP